MDVITSERGDVVTSLRLFAHGAMGLYSIHVCTKFEANRLKNMATVAQKPQKRLKMDVFTSLRHDVVASSKFIPPRATRPCHTYHVSKYEKN